MKKTNTKKALGMSLISLLACGVMFAGSTYAWFTDEVVASGNKIESGTLKADMEVLKDGQWVSLKENPETKIFDYDRWEPGYSASTSLRILNEGNLGFRYQVTGEFAGETFGPNGESLQDVIDVYMYAYDFTKPFEVPEIKNFAEVKAAAEANASNTRAEGWYKVGTLAEWMALPYGLTAGYMLPEGADYEGVKYGYNGVCDSGYTATVVLHMQEEAGNEYQGLTLGDVNLTLKATQWAWEKDGFGDPNYDSNPVSVDVWDGVAASLNWGPEAYAGAENDDSYVIKSAADLVAFAKQVDNGNSFKDKKVVLDADVDLAGKLFDPIGSYRFDKCFSGEFDGNGHTIYNLQQNTWDLNNGYYYNDCGLGLFGAVQDGTVKNLNIDGVEISGESALCGAVVAVAENAIFENITVKNANVADYQYYAGGIIGWASGTQQILGCTIDESCNIAAQWGDFDNSIGGVIGGASGSAQILMKDVTVACRIDAYNDVTSSYQWYAYRRAGMLIGNSGKTEKIGENTYAVAPQLTCENVTVIYNEWADYHYCEFAGTSWPYVRVEAGVSNSAYSNPRYGHPTDANGNEVIDDNHVHNDGEDHMIVCVFDQLFGGGQGVYGSSTHDGVKVIYNNDKK